MYQKIQIVIGYKIIYQNSRSKKKIQQHQKAKRKHPDVGNSTNFKVNMNNA